MSSTSVLVAIELRQWRISRGSSLGSDNPLPKARYVITYSRKPALSAAESFVLDLTSV